MARYRKAYMCRVCKKVYRSDFWPNVCGSIHNPICPRCGTESSIYEVSAKPRMFGIKGWELGKQHEDIMDSEEDCSTGPFFTYAELACIRTAIYEFKRNEYYGARIRKDAEEIDHKIEEEMHARKERLCGD